MRTARLGRRLGLVLGTTALVAACAHGTSSSPTTTAPRAKIVYVALGDSYSSGEGAPPYSASSGSCLRSELGWAARLAKDVAGVSSFDHRACSAATSNELIAPWTSRHLPAQIPTTVDPSVTLVTLTIGGNDLGFGAIVADCYLLDCSGVPSTGLFKLGLDQLQHRLDDAVYPALRHAYPSARIVHVGYPRLTPVPGQPLTGCTWLSTAEQAATQRIVADLDATIRAATQQTSSGPKIEYLDITDALAGHELCTASSWLRPVSLNTTSQAHPTADGQRAIEQAVISGLRLGSS